MTRGLCILAVASLHLLPSHVGAEPTSVDAKLAPCVTVASDASLVITHGRRGQTLGVPMLGFAET